MMNDDDRARRFECWDREHREDAYYNRNNWRERTVKKFLSAEFAAVRVEAVEEERRRIAEWLRVDDDGKPTTNLEWLAQIIESGSLPDGQWHRVK